jgi:hypothetical protein
MKVKIENQGDADIRVIIATGNTVNAMDGASFALAGVSDTVNLGKSSWLDLQGARDYLVNAAGSNINAWDNTSLTLSGSGNALSVGKGSTASIGGDRNDVSFGSASSISCNGTSNTIRGSASIVTLSGNGGIVSVYGDGNQIAISNSNPANWTICVFGSNNAVSASGAKIIVNGVQTSGNGGGGGGDHGGSGPRDHDPRGEVRLGDLVVGDPFKATYNPSAALADTAKAQCLVAAMASYGADGSASSVFVAPAQNDSQMLLAASAH